MPTFTTVTTFEKPDADLVGILWGIPEFVVLEQLCFPDHSPYLESKEFKATEGNSYVELFLNFHDEAAFLSWYDEFGAIHDAYATILIKKLKGSNIDIKRYFDGTKLIIDAENSMLMSEFTSKF